MNIETFEKQIINEYCKTIQRISLHHFPENIFLKTPYIEDCFQPLIYQYKIDDISEELNYIFEEKMITSNDIQMTFFYFYDIDMNERKNIKQKLHQMNQEMNHQTFILFLHQLFLFSIHYVQYYMIITELFYESEEDKKELYSNIYYYIRNQSKYINQLIKTNFKFQIFYYLTQNIYQIYLSMMNSIQSLELFEEELSEKEIRNHFIKNIFTSWYIIHKQNIEKGISLVNPIKKESKSIFSKLLCIPHS